MRPELETYELIDKYLNNELSGEELLSFEKQMRTDISFAEEVAHQKQVNLIVMGAELDLLRTKMSSDIAELDKGQNNLKRWLGGFFGLMLVGCAGYFFMNTDTIPQKNTGFSKPVSENKEIEKITYTDKVETPVIKEKINKKNKKESDPIKETSAEVFLNPHQEKSIPEKQADTKENSISQNPFYNLPVEEARINCDEVKISAHPSVQGTCKEESNGSLTLYPQNIKGGTAPYLVSMDEQGGTKSREVFSGMEAGKHLLTIQDKTGCITVQEIIIPEKDCPKMNRFAIHPDYGENWKLPVHDSQSGTLSIFTGNGALVYKAAFGSQGTNEWNGTDNYGSSLQAGMYIYIIEYSTGKKDNGQITISR